MNNELIELLEYLRTLDPDEVVDYLGLDTETLVDNLIGVADDWLAEKEEEYDE
jgi:DNA-binding ferritin-like protein (Dps family)